MLRARSKSFLALRQHFSDRSPLEDDKENSPLSMRRKLKQSITNLASRLSPKDTGAKPLSPTSKVPIFKSSPSPPRHLPLRPATTAGIKPSQPPVIPIEKHTVKPAEAQAAPSTPPLTQAHTNTLSPQTHTDTQPRQHASASSTPSTPTPRPIITRTIIRIHNPDDIHANRAPHPRLSNESITTGYSSVASIDAGAHSTVNAHGAVPIDRPSTPTGPPSALTLMIGQLLNRIAAGETINYKLRNPPGYYDPDPECLNFMDSDSDDDVNENKNENGNGNKSENKDENKIKDGGEATPTPALVSTPTQTPTQPRMKTPGSTPRRSRIPVPVKKSSKLSPQSQTIMSCESPTDE
ncbi:hypothetical protein ABW21_db0201440 [Orbilia brochopaga]|nr:hypothetical protein ABW21_db0201440 [Drechslerella brochopaga]